MIKVTMKDIIEYRLVKKQVPFTVGKNLISYFGINDEYIVKFNNKKLIITKNDQAFLQCLNKSQKKLVTIQSEILNQLRDFKKTFYMDLEQAQSQ